MARVRTARLAAAVAAVPLALALSGGVAQADNGAFATGGALAEVTANEQANTATVSGGPAITAIDQENVNVTFSPLW
ncbi:hypothetical protein V1J52_18660 [Streptomyces sp. TRM 70351]|uniref:hypothetical protein n=1 Tax=Streptomyces sp. TRM 70351 TaxID=3116552 RepID=UPI002E7B516F|nr:hypothetical protein [Streptomyces sp. TRM 70351]MEE1930183.1 hypothetical protein [Streptomyces sp. TRM 70351]